MQTSHGVPGVDDADDSRRLAAFVLEEAGSAVTEAATGHARAAVARIADIVGHMLRITHVEPWPTSSPGLPPMLDIRRSGPRAQQSPDPAAGPPEHSPPDRRAARD